MGWSREILYTWVRALNNLRARSEALESIVGQYVGIMIFGGVNVLIRYIVCYRQVGEWRDEFSADIHRTAYIYLKVAYDVLTHRCPDTRILFSS